MKTHYSSAELAGHPGLPQRARDVRRLARRQGWPFIEQKKRGGIVRLFAASALPHTAQDSLYKNSRSAPAPLTPPSSSSLLVEAAPAAVSSAGQLNSWQREVASARKAILDELRRVAAAVGVNRAIGQVVKLAGAGALSEHLQGLVRVANARRGESRTLSSTSIFKWMRDEAKRGFAGLAPAAPNDEHAVPAWAPALLKLYQKPQKHALSYCVDELPKELQPGVPVPSYHQARRFLEKVSNVDLQRGRLGTHALRSIRPYVRRDSSHMLPGDAYTSDGHTFDAEIAHPAHGRPFRPELTLMLDIATRKAVGWSAGLAESTWAVADAMRHAVETSGVPAMWYADRGPGNQNKVQSDESIGLCARLGITITRGRPRNPQGHGLSERHHQSIWIRAAKQLPTYMGEAMDRDARDNVYKLTRRDLKIAGTSRLLMPWRDFLKFCQEQLDAYNARPHRGLPKIRDAASGKLRHMPPNEAWQRAIDEGWEPVRVSADEAVDLFRPQKLCAVQRGLVQLYGNTYFHAALEHYHGERLPVGYDIHDAQHVWVRDRAGRLICVAVWEGNSGAYFPQSVIDQAKERRAEQRIRRAEVRIDEARAELQPPAVIDQVPDLQMELLAPAPAEQQPLPENVVALPVDAQRPLFDSDVEKYRWLLSHRDEVDDEDGSWLAWYRTTSEWFDLFGDSPQHKEQLA